MSLSGLDHVNVRTHHLERMIEFYENVLGMKSGPRPTFSFPGAWMYVDDSPVVHLVGVNAENGQSLDATTTPLRLEHFAFRATGSPDAFTDRFETIGVTFKTVTTPPIESAADPDNGSNSGIFQLHIHDPDGNHIHIDFSNYGTES